MRPWSFMGATVIAEIRCGLADCGRLASAQIVLTDIGPELRGSAHPRPRRQPSREEIEAIKKNTAATRIPRTIPGGGGRVYWDIPLTEYGPPEPWAHWTVSCPAHGDGWAHEVDILKALQNWKAGKRAVVPFRPRSTLW